MELTVTDHAVKRMAQRGVRPSTVQTVIQFGDGQIPVGDGCVSISVSRETACDLAKEGEISPTMVDRMANLVVVVANDNDAVVTVVRPKNRKAARSYLSPRVTSPDHEHGGVTNAKVG